MRYSIVTPTIIRPSLEKLCQTVDNQSDKDYEHILIVDMPFKEFVADEERRNRLSSIPANLQRKFFYCDKRHMNYGHTCRHNIAPLLRGDYVLYVDDDDYLADNDVLRTLQAVTKDWAIFPIRRYGSLYFQNPPGLCKTGTGMFIHKRELGVWPDRNEYEADGHFVEELIKKAPYEVLNTRPLVIMEVSSRGV